MLSLTTHIFKIVFDVASQMLDTVALMDWCPSPHGGNDALSDEPAETL